MPLFRTRQRSANYERLNPPVSQPRSRIGRWRHWLAKKLRSSSSNQLSQLPTEVLRKSLARFTSVRGHVRYEKNQGPIPEKKIREQLNQQVKAACGQSLKSLPVYERHALRDHMLLILDWSRSQSLTVTLQDCAIEAVLNCPLTVERLSPSTYDVLGIEDFVYNLEDALVHAVKREHRQACCDYARFTSASAALLSRSPYEEAAKGSNYSRQAEEIKKHLINLENSSMASVWGLADRGGDKTLKAAMVSDLQIQIIELKEKVSQLEKLHREDFRNEAEWARATKVRLNAGIQVVEQQRSALVNRTVPLSGKERRQAEHLQQVHTSLVNERKAIFEGKAKPASRETMSQSLRKEEKKLVKTIAPSIFARKAMFEAFEKAKTQVVNDRPWEEINKTIPVEYINKDGVRHCVNMKSTIRPAGAMRLRPNPNTAGSRTPFLNDISGHGASSMARDEADNAVNLAATELRDQQGNLRFAGIRSGVMCAFGIKEDNDRKQANLNRAHDVIAAAVMQQIKRHPEIAWQSGEVVNLKLFSNPLLTPDRARHATGINDDELTMLREQLEAMQEEARAKEITIYGADGKRYSVNINVDLLNCNLGVNSLAFGAAGKVDGAWKVVKGGNKSALKQLIGAPDVDGGYGGWVADWLRDNEHHPDVPVVCQLVEQIRSIWNSKSYRKEGDDAFKLVSRLAYLAYKIDAIPHWNCKSGKDRTGEADEAIKRLISETEIRGYVPDPDLPLTRTGQINAQGFAVNSGKMKMISNNIAQSNSKAGTGKKNCR